MEDWRLSRGHNESFDRDGGNSFLVKQNKQTCIFSFKKKTQSGGFFWGGLKRMHRVNMSFGKSLIVIVIFVESTFGEKGGFGQYIFFTNDQFKTAVLIDISNPRPSVTFLDSLTS